VNSTPAASPGTGLEAGESAGQFFAQGRQKIGACLIELRWPPLRASTASSGKLKLISSNCGQGFPQAACSWAAQPRRSAGQVRCTSMAQ